MALRETLDTIRSAPDPRDEENTKFQIITPILENLGWNSPRQEVLYEHSVGGKDGGWVDMALMGPRHPVALIEAKRPGANLDRHVSQMTRYASYEGVDICVLTTGLEWRLYLSREDGPLPERQFAALHIREDPVEKLADSLKTFLGKKNLLNGHAKDKAKQILQAHRRAYEIDTELPVLWRSMLNEPDNGLVELIRQRMHEKIDLWPDHEQVAKILRDSTIPITGPPPTPQTLALTPSKTSQKPTKSRTPAGIQLGGRNYQVRTKHEALFSLAKIAETLYQEHRSEILDWLLDQSSKDGNPWASRNPDKLKEPLALGSTGIYLETNLNSMHVRSRIIKLLELPDNPPLDYEILYD